MRRSAPFPVLFFASAAHGMHHVLLTLYLTLVVTAFARTAIWNAPRVIRSPAIPPLVANASRRPVANPAAMGRKSVIVPQLAVGSCL